jgi:hypothetical protein
LAYELVIFMVLWDKPTSMNDAYSMQPLKLVFVQMNVGNKKK